MHLYYHNFNYSLLMYEVVDCLKLMVDVEEEVRQQAQQELLTLASRSAA